MFTESVILGEIARDLIREAGVPARHRRELGGTQVLFHALEADELDVYPEYTGTISGEILAGKNIRDEADLRAALAERGVGMSRAAGFQRHVCHRDARTRGRAAGHRAASPTCADIPT